jgi:hypothetical protein
MIITIGSLLAGSRGIYELRFVDLIILLMLTTLSLITISLYVSSVSGQVSTNDTRTWLDRENNIKILFSVTPAQPTIGTSSALKFTVQNLQTGKPLTNLLASILILGGTSNQETTFRWTNISAPDGDFSINIIFRNMGSYQVITKISSRSNDVASLASFKVIVQAPPTPTSLFGGNYVIWIGLLFATAAGVASFLILKNTTSKETSSSQT